MPIKAKGSDNYGTLRSTKDNSHALVGNTLLNKINWQFSSQHIHSFIHF